ncbi:MAG TPA: 3'-5' exonuclease [Caldimonas sp.]|jgi:DNA polymerase-3 subunit epsilon|nr:3'-5' exonuclease [Caldimonas sp.]HEX2540392.1 3'-5' exonuclease [Caldimonas sp.]
MWQAASRWFMRRPAIDEARWVVLDVETTGLDVGRDRLLALAAIAVHTDEARPRLRLGDSFEVVLRQPEPEGPPDKANILLHGIGVGAQRQGLDPASALASFAAWAGGSPLLAFHAPFDRAVLEHACRQHGAPPLTQAWLDLAPLAAVLHPDVRAEALDDWLAHFGIVCAIRHQAASDTLATAELLQRLWPALLRQEARPGFAAARRLAEARRWLPG